MKVSNMERAGGGHSPRRGEESKYPEATFLIPAANMSVLTSPSDFKTVLFEGITNAKRRNCIVSLYVGSDQEEFFDLLFHRSADLGIATHILTDYCRTLRPETSNNKSSLAVMHETWQRIKRECGQKKSAFAPKLPHVSLYQTPTKFLGQRFFPYRMQEVLGVLHWKYYVFDDSVILTGANISRTYLTDRTDRWIYLERVPEFAQFLWDLSLLLRKNCKTADLSVESGPLLSDSQWGPECLCPAISKFLLRRSMIRNVTADILFDHVLLRWGVQYGSDPSERNQLRNTEIRMLEQMIAESPPKGTVVLASPYLNLPESMMTSLKRQLQGRRLEVVGCAPNSCSFFNAGPILAAVPFAYAGLTVQALSTLGSTTRFLQFGGNHDTRASFHAKGIWTDGTLVGQPYRTLLGSSNFSVRSATRDLECLCLIETRAPALVSQFRREVEFLIQQSRQTQMVSTELASPHWWTRAVAHVFIRNRFLRSIL